MSANDKQIAGLEEYQITLTRGHVCFVDADCYDKALMFYFPNHGKPNNAE